MHEQEIARPSALTRFAGIFAIAFVVVLGATSVVEAAEWRFAPEVRLAGDYDDNPFLSIRTDFESEAGYIAEASASVAYASDKTDFFIKPTVRSRNYGSNSELNSDDQFLRLNYDHDTQSTTFRFRANYDRESVRTAERADTGLDVDDPDQIPEDDSGLVQIRGRRERLRATPTFDYRVTDVSTLGLQVEYVDVRYEQELVNLLVDYTDTRVNASFRRAWSPRNTFVLTGTARNYQTYQGAVEVKGAGLLTGIDSAISETSRLRALVGVENTEVEGGDKHSNWVANVSYVRRLKTISLLAQYRRSISPSGFGALALRDAVNLKFTRQLSDRVSAGIGARVYTTTAIDETIANLDERNYVQLLAQFTWHLSPAFSLQTDYRYTFLARESLGESANSNQITLWLNFIPTPMVRSR